MRVRISVLTALAALFVLSPCAITQSASTDSKAMTMAQPTMTAKLVDPQAKAAKKEATVVVEVTGVAMIDPASVGEKPSPGQGHLHYQVDQGPIIATTATKLSFHELSPGAHKIKVVLAQNNHQPAGPETTLDVTVP